MMSKTAVDQESKVSRVERVYRTLKNRILCNEFPPGYQVLEPELADKMGVSRTPVREALIRLESERLIELVPRRGMRVIPLRAEDIEEIYDLLQGLEYSFVECLSAQQLDEKNLVSVRYLLSEMKKCLKSRELREWVLTENALQDLLFGLCKNSRLSHAFAVVNSQLARVRLVTLKMQDSAGDIQKNYEQFLDYASKQQWKAAKELRLAHRRYELNSLLETLKELNLPYL